MTKEEKNAYVALSRRRYSELKSKKEKGEFLDGFCPVMGIDRKNAIRLLSPREKPHRRRGRPFATGMDARKLLVAIWKKAGRPCARLLAPVLGMWIESLRRHGEEIPDGLAAEVTGVSASTIDRRLRASRPRIGGGRRSSSLAEHRREIPTRPFAKDRQGDSGNVAHHSKGQGRCRSHSWRRLGASRSPFGAASASCGCGKDEGNGMCQEQGSRSVTPFMTQPRKCRRQFR